jgi:hypothetical protein
MSGEDFDNLTRALGSRAISRRRALQLAAASAIGAAGLGAATREAEAHPTCPRRTPRGTCNSRCTGTRKECFCIRTTEGNRVCIHPCCSNLRCTLSRQCPGTDVCIQSPCCPGGKVCTRRCNRPRPRRCPSPRTASGAAWRS